MLHGDQVILSQEAQDLARHLLAHEALGRKASEATESAVVRVCDKLRAPLCGLVGVAGYRSLLSRALTLAKAQASSLSMLQLSADGTLQGLRELELGGDKEQAVKGGVILISQLLALFLAFLGKALTWQMLKEIFPNLNITTKPSTPMPFENILQEVDQLNHVSERLQYLADQHPIVEDGLLSISGNIRNAATVLEVFALIKNESNGLQTNVPKQQHKKVKRYLM